MSNNVRRNISFNKKKRGLIRKRLNYYLLIKPIIYFLHTFIGSETLLIIKLLNTCIFQDYSLLYPVKSFPFFVEH